MISAGRSARCAPSSVRPASGSRVADGATPRQRQNVAQLTNHDARGPATHGGKPGLFVVPEENRSGPVSRVLSRAAISLGRRLPVASSNLPGSGGGPDRPAPGPVPGSSLFGLAPSGVCPADPVTRIAVRSYRTISPLPRPGGAAVYFLWHFPDPCGRWVLPTTASCGARTFLCANNRRT